MHTVLDASLEHHLQVEVGVPKPSPCSHLQEGDWPAVAPDVILQLGGHLTSKRLGQFLDWAALGAADR